MTPNAYAEKLDNATLKHSVRNGKISVILKIAKEDKKVVGISTKGGVEYYGLGVSAISGFCSFIVLDVGRIILIDINEIASITIE